MIETKTVTAEDRAKRVILAYGGPIRTVVAIKKGIHPRTLYKLRDEGALQELSRGLFHMDTAQPLSKPDLVTVASRVPKAVICLISALSFHQITTQIPHAVSIALPQGAATPRIDYPPVTTHHFSGSAFTEGIEEHSIDGITVKIYCVEKTLADCFKFRNKIGMDVVIEALKLYKARKDSDLRSLLKYARVCRVEKVMTPYLEAIL